MKKQEDDTMRTKLRVERGADPTRRGFTLLEILLVLVLIVVLLGGLASLIRVFTNSYFSNERRVGRAQLARSISQMLEDDLGAAIQDPIQAVAEDANRQFIRHFGLRGDARSLQIDVVQPSLFAKTATVDENIRVQSGGDKSAASRQAPELKTIFYEFVPINASEVIEGQQNTTNGTVAAQGEDLGSSLTGSLSSTSPDSALSNVNGDVLADSSSFRDPTLPLAQKYGLSRRELDFETPEEDTEETDQLSAYDLGASIDPETGAATSTLSGSLTSAPTTQNSTLTSTDPSVNAALGIVDATQYVYKEPLTAVQIAMDSDDGTTWAPEVLDCRFSYFDGEKWRDSWDSIQDKGLPIAIKVELKMAPLDDVDLYRSAPIFAMLPVAPDLETLSKLATAGDQLVDTDEVNVSRLAGSLTRTAKEKGEPVDVFNSYRPLAAIRAAMEGVVTNRDGASTFAEVAASAMLLRANELETQNASSPGDMEGGLAFSSGLGGSLNGSSTSTDGALGGGLTSGTANTANVNTGDPSLDPSIAIVQEMMANGAVFNEAGICVDFSNDGSYVTLEQIAEEIGVTEPNVYEVIVYLPTTPLSRATTVQRRVATTVRQGNVSQRRNTNAAGGNSRDRRAQGQNPYATGRARQSQPRERTERTRNERTAQDRQRADRQTAERGRADRQAVDRGGPVERQANNRQVNERQGGEARTANTRETRERVGRNGGWTDDSPNTVNYGNRNANNRAQVGDTNGVGGFGNAAADLGGLGDRNAVTPSLGQGGGLAGGLAGNGGATQIQTDPFAIVDQQMNAASSAPFASQNADMDIFGGMTTPGLIETPNGTNTVASPTAPAAPQRQGQQQTWIRGKK